MRFRSFLLVLSVVANTLVLSKAAPLVVEVPPIANTPATIRASIPRGGKTWFYGKAPTELSKRATYLHFYSIPTRRLLPTPNVNANRDNLVNPSDYILDVWQRNIPTRRNRMSPLRRINSIPFSGAEFLNAYNGYLDKRNKGFVKITAQVLWLRDSTRQTSILRLRIELGNGVNASFSLDDLLFVFRNGLLNRPHLQQFSSYFELLESARVRYDQIDEQGILKVEKENQVQGGMDAPINKTITEFLWNGNEFVAGIPVISPPQ